MTYREALTLVREKVLAEALGQTSPGVEARYRRSMELYPAVMAVAHAGIALELDAHRDEQDRGGSR